MTPKYPVAAGRFESQLEKGSFGLSGTFPAADCATWRWSAHCDHCKSISLLNGSSQLGSINGWDVLLANTLHITLISYWSFWGFFSEMRCRPTSWLLPFIGFSAVITYGCLAARAKSWIISALTIKRKKNCIPKENKGFLKSHHIQVLLSAFCPIKNEGKPCLLWQVQVLTPQVNNRHLPNVRLINWRQQTSCWVCCSFSCDGGKKTLFFFALGKKENNEPASEACVLCQ